MVPVVRSAILTALLLCVASCHRTPQLSLDSTYSDALDKFNRGDFPPALAEIDGALAKLGDAQDSSAWRLRLLKAEILIWQGHHRDVITLLALSPAKASGLSRSLAARRLALLGVAESSLQNMDTAADDFHQAELLNRPEQPSTTCMLLLGQGKVAAIHDQPDVARDKFVRALSIARTEKLPLSQASAMGNLGMLDMRTHQYGDAVDWFNASLVLARAQHEAAPTIRLIGNLGWAYLETGDLDRSEEHFEEAAAMARQNGMISDEETWLSNTAAVELLQRNYAQSRTSFERSLALARKLEDRQEVIYNLNDLAKLAILQNDPALAQQMNREAFTLEKVIGDRDSALYSTLNEALIALANGDVPASTRYLREIVSTKRADVKVKSEALGTLAKIEARQHHVDAAVRLFEQAAALLDNAQANLQHADLELSYPTNAEGIYGDYIRTLMSNGRQVAALSVVETHRMRTLMTQARPASRSRRGVSKGISERAASKGGHIILSYWLGSGSSYVWLIDGRDVHVATLPDQDCIRSMVEQYRARWTSSFGHSAAESSAGEDLYRALVAPLSQWIPPGAEISIVPDGVLCGLNFETLVVPSPTPHYWIEDVSLSVARSVTQTSHASVLPTLGAMKADPKSAQVVEAAQRTTQDRLLLLGDPQAPSSYPALSHAREEVTSVASHFDPSEERVITGSAATPSAYFAARPEDYSIIHFVAHGTASRTSPLDSAVVLSDDGRSYNLYARGVMEHPIRARLVIISSCDSAGKRIYSTQGLVGMSWAFLHAGAREVIAALWDVNDDSAPRFMDQLYEMIANGQDPGSALRQAKLRMLRSKTIYAKPFYWAPFVLYEGE